MTPLGVVATRMGTRAGQLWRSGKVPVRNPFRHPALRELAAEWRRAFLAAAQAPDRR